MEKAVVKAITQNGHTYLRCTVTDVPMGASVVTPGEVKEDYAVVSVQTREQLLGLGLGYVACPKLTVYNGGARLAYKSSPQGLALIGGSLQHSDFLAQLDALKSERDAKALVVLVELPPGLFLSNAVKKRVVEKWAVGGNFDGEHEWHLVIPNMALRDCFWDLENKMPNVYVHEHFQEALGFRGPPAAITMTVNLKSGSGSSLRHMLMPGFTPRRRHDGSYEIKGLVGPYVSFDLLVYGDAQLEVQLDGVEVPVTQEYTEDKSWLDDADFVFYLANRRPTPSNMGKALLQELAGESGNGGASAEFGASGSNLHRSASVFGAGWC